MTKNTDIANILDQATTFNVSAAVGANVIANTTTLRVGNTTVNVVANSTSIKLANSTVNTQIVVPSAAEYAGNYYLHANGTWQLVAAGATPGGTDTHVQYNDGGALGGTAGFTFNETTNNVLIANTLTIGTATVNSTNYSQTANNALNLGGTAAASYQLNSTLAANVATMTANNANNLGANIFANSTGAYPISNTSGAVLGDATHRFIITGNSATFSSTLAATDTTITGFVNATASVNSAALTTAGIRANATGVYPSSNTVGQALGSTTTRWILLANTIESTGLANLSALNVVNQTNTATLFVTTSANVGTAVLANSIGLTTTGFVNAATVVNSAAYTIASTFIANTLGVTHTGFVNAATVVNSASHTVGTVFAANTLGVFHTLVMNAASHTTTGVTANVTGVYPTSNTSGQALGLTAQRWVLFANSIDVSGTWTANGALGGASQILTSNSIGGAYWAAPTGGGDVTKVGTPVDDQVGVWTGSGTIEGTAGFTFSAASNNAVVANTLTVGTATVNSTLAVLAALNVTNQVNTATLLSTGLANLNALNVTNQTNTATLFVTTSANVGTTFTTNSTVTNAVAVTTAGIRANATGVYPSSNTVGQALGSTTTRWILLANTIESTGLTNVNALNVVNQTNTTTFFATTSANVGANVQLTTAQLFVGNSVANMVVNSITFTISNSSNFSQINPSYMYNGNGVTAAVQPSGTMFWGGNNTNYTISGTTAASVPYYSVANATGNAILTPALFTINAVSATTNGFSAAPNLLQIGNTSVSANMSPTGFIAGISIVNSTVISVGANVLANTTTVLVGNSTSNVLIGNNIVDIGNTTVNLVANSMSIKISNSTVNTHLDVPTSVQYSATNYFLHANGSWIQVTAGGGSPGGANTYIQYNDSGAFNGTAGFTYDETTNNVTLANTLSVGANVVVNTAAMQIGNASVNGLANSVALVLANSSGTLSMTPIDMQVGNSIVNTTTISANLFQGVTASIAANGYTYLFNGLILQWGWVLANSSVGNVTFPLTFPTNQLWSAACLANTAALINCSIATTTTNTSSMNVRTSNLTASNCRWISIGN